MERGESTSCNCCRLERGKLRGFIQLTVDITIWAIVGLPVLLMYRGAFKPYSRGFFCNDDSLRYPYKEDTISDSVLLTSGFLTTFILFILTEVPKVCASGENIFRSKNFRCLVKITFAFVFGFTILQGVSQSLKYATGRLRPHFMDVCKPDFSKINCSQGYIVDFDCTETRFDADVVRRSRASFPSGHASFSMYCAIFVSLFLEIRLHVWWSRILKPVLQTLLVMMSLLCSITRLYDNKHHVSDVTVGSIIGLVVAVFVFKTLGEKALRTRQTTFEFPNLRRKMKPDIPDDPPCTPTPLLIRENSSLSMDSKKYLCPNSSSIALTGLNGVNCM